MKARGNSSTGLFRGNASTTFIQISSAKITFENLQLLMEMMTRSVLTNLEYFSYSAYSEI